MDHEKKLGPYLHEAVFGYQDGLVSTFALIAGMTAAVGSAYLILLAALIEAVAGAISMGLGSYNSSKSEQAFFRSHKQRMVFVAPWRLALMMSAFFVVGAFLAILPFLFVADVLFAFRLTCVLSVVGLFVAGAVKSHYIHCSRLKGGLEMTVIGVVASVAAYGAGHLISLLL